MNKLLPTPQILHNSEFFVNQTKILFSQKPPIVRIISNIVYQLKFLRSECCVFTKKLKKYYKNGNFFDFYFV